MLIQNKYEEKCTIYGSNYVNNYKYIYYNIRIKNKYIHTYKY